MRELLRLYGRYVGISVRGQMQHRASFLMMTAGAFLLTAVEFLAVVTLFRRFGSLRGWSLPEVALFYGMVGTAFALSEAVARGFDTFAAQVKGGDFDRLLLRPRGTAFQVAASELQLMRLGRFTQALLVLLWAASRLETGLTPGGALLIGLTVAGGVCLFCGLWVLQAALCFWTVEGLEVMNTLTYGGVETAQYPLPIYRPWFRAFFTFVVPLATVNYVPASAVLGRGDALGVPPLLAWLSPLTGVLFLALALRAWRVGVGRYCSTGS